MSLAPAGHDVYVNMTNSERRQFDYRGEILRRAYEAGASDRPVFARLAEDQSSVEYEPAKALATASASCGGTMVVDGQERAIAEVARDPELCGLVSDEGPLRAPRAAAPFA